MKALYRALALVLISYGLARAQTVSGGGGSGNVSDGGTNGGVYRDSSGALHASATGGAGTLCLTSANGGVPVFGSCAGTPATAWDSLTAPSGNLAIAMGLNLTAFTWAGNTSANNLFSLKDTTGNTGTGSLLEVHTVGTSSAKPVTFTAKGTANGVQMDNTGALAKIGTGSIAADSMAVGGLTGLGTGVGTWFATPSGANLASALTTSLPASKGGTGVANTATLTLGSSNQNWATLGTGIVKNTTTTGAISDAASADVYGLWSGTCNSTTFLRGDGACATPSGSGTVTVSGGGSLTTTAFMTGVGTTVSQTPSATSTLDSSGNAAFAGTVTATGGVASGSSPPSLTSGSGGVQGYGEGTVPTVCAAAAVDCIYADSTQHGFLASFNNGSYLPLVQGPASTTANHLAVWNSTNGGLLKDITVLPVANGGTGTASTLTGLVRGSGSAMTAAELSGDATTSGSNVVTVAKVNGVSSAATPSNHTVQVVTASNTRTDKVVPDCTDTAGNHINFTQSSDAFSCGTSSPQVSPTAGTSVSLSSGISQMFVCTSTCTITVPVPAAGAQYCVYNDDNVTTVITMSAIGSSARYENTARTAYGTAGTGTFVSSGAAGDRACLIYRDSTHYTTIGFNGTWTAN